MEYLGRIDHQVEIRGFRIEVGEIEEQLLKIDSVQETIVIAREGKSGQELCASLVASLPLTLGELRSALAQKLPNYMIPAHFVQLPQMPLTPNDKIDRKALPAPEGNALTGGEYVAPRNEAERTLADVWQAVLNADRVGVTDHFFELGGDSIKSIQVSSRLHQAGYKLEIRDLFKYPTISQLSLHVIPIGRTIDQGEITGETALTPIQHWFFESSFADPHHFNQSVMLYRKERFDEEMVVGVRCKSWPSIMTPYGWCSAKRNKGLAHGTARFRKTRCSRWTCSTSKMRIPRRLWKRRQRTFKRASIWRTGPS